MATLPWLHARERVKVNRLLSAEHLSKQMAGKRSE
ncbi:hypothetical protein AAKU58_000775 [Oxalobacteraceae bacterium GrIS 1.18]